MKDIKDQDKQIIKKKHKVKKKWFIRIFKNMWASCQNH